MSVTKGTLAAGEDYASVADLLAADDLPHDTITVWGWKVGDTPVKLRVHGLTLVQREAARAAARHTDGTHDAVELIAQFLHYGCAAPTLTLEQARQLTNKHAGSVEGIADYISAMTEVDYAQLAAIAMELARADAQSEPTPARARARRKAA
jgi:hypothetical protein